MLGMLVVFDSALVGVLLMYDSELVGVLVVDVSELVGVLVLDGSDVIGGLLVVDGSGVMGALVGSDVVFAKEVGAARNIVGASVVSIGTGAGESAGLPMADASVIARGTTAESSSLWTTTMATTMMVTEKTTIQQMNMRAYQPILFDRGIGS